jgi:hypothetical protein
MKYKEQALFKIEQVSNQISSIESGINRAISIGEIKSDIEGLKELIYNLQEIISIENDEWKD